MPLAHQVLALAAVCSALAATRVVASFECDQVWGGPSKDNEWTTCLGNVSHMKHLYLDSSDGRNRAVGGGVIPFIIVIVAFFLYPVVLIGRYVCNLCGSNRRRPGTICCGGAEWDEKSEAEKQAAYDPKCRLCTRASPMLIALLAVIPFALMLAGGVRVLSTYNNTFDRLHDTVGYFHSRVADARIELMATANNTTANTSVLSVIDSYFDDADKAFVEADDTLTTYHDDYDHIAKAVGIVGIVIAVVPLPFFVVVILLALCNVRRCLPCAWTGIQWVLLLLYGAFAVAALVVAGVAWDACDEVHLGSSGAPGILSWYVAPLLNDSLPFASIITAVDAVEAEYAYKACDGLLTACDANIVYDPSGAPDKFIYCPTLTDARSQCGTIDDASAMLGTVVVKATAPVSCTSGATCTARECASTCAATVPSSSADAAAAELRSELTDLLDLLSAADAATDVWNATLKPMLSGDWIVQTAATRIDTCDDARSGLLMLGVGATFFAALSAATIIILFLGQKRWFAPLEKEAPAPF